MMNQWNSRSQRRKSSNKKSMNNKKKILPKSRWIRATGAADRIFTGAKRRSGFGIQWEGKFDSKED